jgi:UDP-glucose 4-epimerase
MAAHLRTAPAGTFHTVHLGTGNGYSNLDIVKAAERAVGKPVQIKMEGRREGDPPSLFADNRRARELLNFAPKHSDLDTILGTAWAWHQGRS